MLRSISMGLMECRDCSLFFCEIPASCLDMACKAELLCTSLLHGRGLMLGSCLCIEIGEFEFFNALDSDREAASNFCLCSVEISIRTIGAPKRMALQSGLYVATMMRCPIAKTQPPSTRSRIFSSIQSARFA